MRIVFCGACNPTFNMKDLASKVIQEFPDDRDEILLLLNGCRTGCLKPPNFVDAEGSGRVGMVYVAGTSVDGFETGENDLADVVGDAVRSLRDRLC